MWWPNAVCGQRRADAYRQGVEVQLVRQHDQDFRAVALLLDLPAGGLDPVHDAVETSGWMVPACPSVPER